jgi:hypothetical protein
MGSADRVTPPGAPERHGLEMLSKEHPCPRSICTEQPFMRQPSGTTDIDVVVVRDGKNLKGRVLGFVLGTIGRRVLERAFENSVKAIELRNTKP